jgi:hypothetical protein
VLAVMFVVAVTMIPRQMRGAQAEATDDTTDRLGDVLATHELQPELAN